MAQKETQQDKIKERTKETSSKYLAQKETQQIKNVLISCDLVETIRLFELMLVCMAPTRILCFDLNNGHMTFKLKKVDFQGHGPPDRDPSIRVI